MTRLDVDLALMRADVIVDVLRETGGWLTCGAIMQALAESGIYKHPDVIYGDLLDLETAGRVQGRGNPDGPAEWRALEKRPDIAAIASALGGLDDGR